MHIELTVSSTDRTLGTIFGSEITRLHGSSLPDDTYIDQVHTAAAASPSAPSSPRA